MSRPARDYAADDAQMRAGWRLVLGLALGADVAGIVAATRLPRALALRLWLLREAGGLRAIELWADHGTVTVGQLQRAVLSAPYDDAAQVADLARVSGQARAMAKR